MGFSGATRPCATSTRLFRLINTQKQGAARHPRPYIAASLVYALSVQLPSGDEIYLKKIKSGENPSLGKKPRTNKAAKSKTDRFSKASLMLMFVQCAMYIVQVPTSLLISSPYEISGSKHCINNCAICASPLAVAR